MTHTLKVTAVALLLVAAHQGQSAAAAVATGTARVEVVTPTVVSLGTGGQILISNEPGAFGIRIVAAIPSVNAALGVATGLAIELTAIDGVVRLSATSASDLAKFVNDLAASGGTVSVSDVLSGHGVEFKVLQDTVGSDGLRQVSAIVSYN